MARSRYHFVNGTAPHFLTVTVVNWVPLFGSPSITKIVLDSLAYLHREQRWMLYAYVILENHLHLIASANESSGNLSKEVASFKSYTARQIIDYLKAQNAERVLKQLAYYKLRHRVDRDFQLWQEGSHPEMIQGEAMMRQKIEYIHNNPVKRGFVDQPIAWRYSSARNYAGIDGLITVETRW